MVSGTTIKHTNAKTRTNARKLTRTIAPKMPPAKTPMVVSSAHVMLDSRVMVSHASLPTVNITIFSCPNGLKSDDIFFDVLMD